MPVPVEPLRIRFTLAELLTAISACCGILIGYKLIGLLGAATAGLCVGAALFFWGRRTHRPGVWMGGLALAVPSAGVACIAVLGITFLNIGPVYNGEDWPLGFTQMANLAGADTSGAKIYCRSNFIDSEYVWRLSLSEKQIQRVVEKLGWRSVSAHRVPSEFRQAFPFWWRPTATTSCQFYTALGFPIGTRGSDGEYYLAMYDPQSQQLYVWYKFNF